MDFVNLSYGDVAIAGTLVLLNGLVSLVFRLKLEERILVSAARMIIQLLLVGFVLERLFAARSPWLTLLVALAMVIFAGREATARLERGFTGWWSFGLGTASSLVASALVTLLALTTAVRPEPWYDARFAVPMLGMILGNTMNGISLGLGTLTAGAAAQAKAIEAQLCLGRDFATATRPLSRSALRAALTPVVNAMSATGLVAIPGMMTGQILSGVAPDQAVRYQLLIMFLIAGSTAIGSFGAVMLGLMRLTDERHRLRLDRLRAPRE